MGAPKNTAIYFVQFSHIVTKLNKITEGTTLSWKSEKVVRNAL